MHLLAAPNRALLLFFGCACGLVASAPGPAQAPPHDPDRIRSLAEGYLATIQAQEWRKMQAFLDPDARYLDYSMEHFGRERMDLRGAGAIVDFWRTSSEDAGSSEIELRFSERFLAGPNLILIGESRGTNAGAAWRLPMETFESRFPQVTHLRVVDGKIVRHVDHVDYGTAERQIAEQVRDHVHQHGVPEGDLRSEFPVTEVDEGLYGLAEAYLSAAREQRWDDMAAFYTPSTLYQDFTMEHWQRPPVDLRGPAAIVEFWRRTTEGAGTEEVGFTQERRFLAGTNVFLIGTTRVKNRGDAWGADLDHVEVEARHIVHLRFDDGKISYHADYVDFAAADAQVREQLTPAKPPPPPGP